MKTVVIGEGAGFPMDEIMKIYPRHKSVVETFVAQGVVLGIGPLMDGGNLAIFKTRESAEAFVKVDPFLLEGVVKKYLLRDWNDTMLPD